MADSAISALSAVTVVNDTDVLALVQGGVSMKATVGRLNRKVTNASTGTQALTANTLTKLTASDLAMPSGVSPSVGTLMQWKVILGKTSAAGTAALVFHIRAGTAGTTADTAIHTFTFNVSTAVVDTGRLDLLLLFNSVGSGTSAVSQAAATMSHSLSTTGLINVPGQTVQNASSGYDSTVAGTIFTLSANTGATNAITIYQVAAEAVNV